MAKDRLPPLNALRAFEAAARRGSFVEAATDLNVTHWAVGKQIRLLEDWLGVPLFERRSRGVSLTDEGAELLGRRQCGLPAALGGNGEAASAGSSQAGVRAGARQCSAQLRPALAVSAIGGVPGAVPEHRCSDLYDLPQAPVYRDRLRRGGPLGSGAGRGTAVRNAHGRFAAPRVQRGPAAQTPGRNRARPAPSRHPAFPDHAVRVVSLVIRGRRAELRPVRQLELEHVYLQLQAAVEGLGVALASMPLIEGDIAAGRLVCPIAAPAWHAGSYELVVSEDRARNAAVRAFRNWIVAAARKGSTEVAAD